MITKLPQLALGATLVISLLGTGVFYVQKTNSTINEQRSQITSLEGSLEQNKQAYQRLQEDYIRAFSIIKSANESIENVKQQNSDLRTQLATNQLGILLQSETEDVETVVNQATSDYLRCMEIMSGSPLTEDEIDAKTPKEFNSRCPWLFDNTSN